MSFAFVVTLDCAFSGSLGGRNKHLSPAGKTLVACYGNNGVPPYLPTRRTAQDLILFDPHSRRNCGRTGREENTHHNDSSFHVVRGKLTTIVQYREHVERSSTCCSDLRRDFAIWQESATGAGREQLTREAVAQESRLPQIGLGSSPKAMFLFYRVWVNSLMAWLRLG